MAANKQIVDDFGDIIADELRTNFASYNSGEEREFISDVIPLLDNIVLHSGGQTLHAKTKNIDRTPKVEYEIPDHVDMPDDNKKYRRELADLLLVANFFENGSVKHRQALISQSKCMKKREVGYVDWKIDLYQFVLLNSLPPFELDYKASDERFNFSPNSTRLFNYSFVSNAHRPFFYRSSQMEEYMINTSGNKTTTFRHGTNPVTGLRLMLSILKRFLRGAYGEKFQSGSKEYNLLDEIYTHAPLSDSKSSNVLPDGGEETPPPEGVIIQFDVNLDGDQSSFDEMDEGGLRL